MIENNIWKLLFLSISFTSLSNKEIEVLVQIDIIYQI